MQKSLLAFFLFFSISAFAQEKGSVSGTIVEKTSKQPVEFATVQLLKPDSSVVTTAITDKRGRFEVTNVAAGKYIFKASFIGYDKTAFVIDIAGGPKKNL